MHRQSGSEPASDVYVMDRLSIQNDQHDELLILSVINTWFAAFQLWDFLVCCPEEIRRLYVPEARRFWKRRIPPSLGTIL
ncbi:hypothetical protein CBOM_05702 [Ceraceosorus bombacis]|uniref:Uncharacterized protein n=1 Tax=Ceraceosorus bombacis TaxID=401625 RepID=A0A0P1BS62_9BASI|nr:hypothetical protein CBOM_05702 [Ceraceosorus bombacis]